MDVNKYVKSEHYAAVVETDRGLTINGAFIPGVIQSSVKCDDARDGLHEVTLSFVTDSFIRLSGKPSKDYEGEHGYAPDYSLDGNGKKMDKGEKREYTFSNGKTTITGRSEILRAIFGAAAVMAWLGEMDCSLEEIHVIGNILRAATDRDARSLL